MKLRALILLFVLLAMPLVDGDAQEVPGVAETTSESVVEPETEAKVADKVDVDPVNSDEKISDRLLTIFEATTWFDGIEVRVDGGVAFLTGQSDTETHRDWAEKTAMNTSDVVAVVNRLSVAEKPIWNFAPAIASLKELARDATNVLPLVAIAIVIAVLFYYLAIAGARLTRWLGRDRIESGLPVTLVKSDEANSDAGNSRFNGKAGVRSNKPVAVESTDAEGDLSSDRAEIERVTEGEGAVADEANLLKAKST